MGAPPLLPLRRALGMQDVVFKCSEYDPSLTPSVNTSTAIPLTEVCPGAASRKC